MTEASRIEGLLKHAFPPRIIDGDAAPHSCEECEELNAALRGLSWQDVPQQFVEENEVALTLLSDDSYLAFLPAWLRFALREPDASTAELLLVVLESARLRSALDLEQSAAVVEVVRFVINRNIFGSEDPVNCEHLANIERIYGAGGADCS